MDLSQIQLIATDMDGTLLNSQDQVSARFYDVYHALKAQGVTFVAASGRQYYSLAHKLNSIKKDLYFIAENGALLMHQDKELGVIEIKKEKYLELLQQIQKIEGSQLIVCGRKTAYLNDHGPEFLELFSEFYERYKIIEDLTQIDDQILKLAICNINGTETHVYPQLQNLEGELKVKVSGKIWLDLSHSQANKGNALQKLQKLLNITAEQTMVFGDYNNDLEMMEAATYSFAMKNAHPNILKAANYSTESNDNYGVERILEKVLEAKLTTQAAI
ncbi:HAD family hydrolase [Aquimarina sp. 2-A2]|uniref:HAD family hydrolase n=1 Tax=Aquimarina sp. 2-A2 TaxID=3382644 RepID=UPI00387F2833